MKKLLFITVILAMLCAVCFGTVSTAYAEELPTEPTETVITTENPNDDETGELKEKLAQALAKINELTDGEDWFKNKVLPFIINGAIDLILVALFILRPYIKNKSLIKQLTGYVEALQAERDNLTKLLNSSDPNEIKNAVESLFSGKIDTLLNEFENKYGKYLKDVVSMKATVELNYTQFKNFIAAARIAWASKPEAALLLAESPTKTTLEETIAENERLKAYIRELKGEEADNIINESKEA